MKYIKIKGARVHNLKNVNLLLPKNKLIVFTGVSGSGKSSLAFDTIFAEGQRRYIESLSPYARQFLGQMDRPDVDEIEGLSPAIAIGQKPPGRNPRSTVATLTEIYDYLRILFARLGRPYCPTCGREIQKLSPQEMVDLIIAEAEKEKAKEITILSPIVRGRKGEYYQLFYDLLNKGFSEARIDSKFYSLHHRIILSRYKIHTIEAVIDRIMPQDKSRLAEAVDLSLAQSQDLITVLFNGGRELILSSKRSCPQDEFSFPEIEPRLFSFNSPYGACPECHGLGKEIIFSDIVCKHCRGQRLKKEARSIKISDGAKKSQKNICDLVSLTVKEARNFFASLEKNLKANQLLIAKNVLTEINSRLEFLIEVGLDYLTLDREAGTLSGGEAQRIRLASQIGSKLSGALYVLDEPTIGLHEKDNEKLLKTLKELRDLGNTLIVVEHDERTINESDYLVDLGPGPGRRGGEVIQAGTLPSLLKKDSLTLRYIKGEEKIEIPNKRRLHSKEQLKIIGARANNLKNINCQIPLRRFICLTGVSGSGKSTLLFDVVDKWLSYFKGRRRGRFFKESKVSKILGAEYIDRVIKIDQSPIGRTPRSNTATYTGLLGPVRFLFASLPAARERAFGPGRFSFNVSGGRCEACQGAGYNLVEMHFLPPVLVLCDVCQGRRFNRETLAVKYKNKNISDILNLTVEEALEIFEDIPQISDKLKILKEVGLGYVQLGQSATTLSGGEAQRIKLSRELSKPMMRRALYLLDEPTTGLHYDDIKMLLSVIQALVNRGNTVIVIEHNLHVIKTADYIIDLGPEGGEKGGEIVACGTPEEIIKIPNSYTGQYLKRVLSL